MANWKYGVALATLCVCSLHAAPSWAAKVVQSNATEIDVPVASIQEFVQIFSLVKDNYVSPQPDQHLFELAIKGMVSGLDRYSRYLSANEYQQLVKYTEGDIASVDFELEYNAQKNQWLIAGLRPDADSAKQGLKNGLSVFKIDGQDLKTLNHDQVNSLLTGAIATSLTLQLAPTTKELTIVRNKKIDTDLQAQMLSSQILCLKVRVFQQHTAAEIKNTIDQYRSKETVKGVILDLRNNPGGLLSAAVETADLFLNQGLIVTTKSRAEGEQQFQALPGNELNDLKLGILINNRSASAAEVFTAAMKTHKRAWVVGEKSYGKGVVQKLFPLPNGAALQMTVANYYTPTGQMIEGVGIQPHQPYSMQVGMSEQAYLDRIADMLAAR
jgi:carboxyl-terminal processing protease